MREEKNGVKMTEYVSDNIMSVIKNTEKIKVLKMLNCDEKYTCVKASDFELFDEWERLLPLAAGHGEAKKYAEELSALGLSPVRLSEYSRERSIDRWRTGNSGKFVGTFEECSGVKRVLPSVDYPEKRGSYAPFDIEKRVSDNAISCRSLAELSVLLTNDAKKAKSADIMLILNASGCKYTRPDPYLAEQVFGRKNRDEFFNSNDTFVLNAQLLVELILTLKRERKISLCAVTDGDISAAASLVRYLHRRRIFEGEARIYVGMGTDMAELSALVCEVYPRICVHPVIDCGTAELSVEGLLSLFDDYPVGAFLFENGEKCTALASAIEKIAESAEHAEMIKRRVLT